MDLNTIQALAVSVGLPSLLASIIPLIITRRYSQKDKNEDSLQKMKELEDIIKNLQTDLNSYIDLLKKLVEADKEIMKDRIVQMYNYYYKEKKYMPIYTRESLQNIYSKYIDLDENGVIKGLVEKMFSLPTDPTED